MKTEYLNFQADYMILLGKKFALGGDYWTSPDNHLGKGSPYSARDVAILLYEMKASQDLTQGLGQKFLNAWKPSGVIQTYPGINGPICHIIGATRVLCYLGFSTSEQLQATVQYLLKKQHIDGGWRCSVKKMGRKPEWDTSNPGTTLEALDIFRFYDHLVEDKILDNTIEFLLNHFDYKLPLGPCEFGQGSLFNKTEFPFFRYNLFYYVYVLSFYRKAHQDSRFLAALDILQSKINSEDGLLIENPNKGLSELSFCQKGQANPLANGRYLEIIKNIKA